MRKIIFYLLFLTTLLVFSQENNSPIVYPSEIKYPVGFSVTASLRDKPVVQDFRLDHSEFYFNSHRDRKINPNIHPPVDFDAIYQGQFNQNRTSVQGVTPSIIKNFSGQDSGSYPPDANGAVNDNYYFQVVNVTYAIYDKNGNILAGPSNLNTIFDSNLPGANCNNGDPIVLWDEQANKWFYAEFSLCNNNDYMLIAVSQTDDPTGAWWSWSFDVDDMPDYMKFGIWQDGYYMATNTSNGNDVYVFERNKMIVGDANPAMIAFDNPNRPNTFDGFHCILPFDNDGQWAPSNTHGQFITIVDDGQNNTADELWLYQLNADWNNLSNSTFQRTQTISVSPFSGNFSNDWNNIPQPGTSQKLDGLSTILMYRANYRNFNGDERLVITHTIAENSTEAAIRWYELQKNGSNWSIRQEGNINPDNISRWNSSIAINAQKEIGIGFSVSDANSTYPGIRIMGQTTAENNNASGIMDIDETIVVNGQYAQTNYNRWGDYSNISVDPTDGRTFWYTNEYNKSNTHGTQIVAFKFPDNCTAPSNQASNFQATAQSETQIDLTWVRGDGDKVIVLAREENTVNTDPQDGTSYNADSQFGNGDEVGTDNYVVYIGTGTSISVTGLNNSTTYYFTVYEFNDTDFCYLTPGETVSAQTFGLAQVVTLPMLQVNDFDAQGQGNVVSENGSPVTERGLCWSENPNPTTSDSYASNGVGTGTYTVDLTGLNINTTYYVRAYAINSTGIAYGDEISFTTGCAAISDFPYLQNFNDWSASTPDFSCTTDGSVNFDQCWENQTGDDSDWDIISGSTATSNTGPSDDVNGGGQYIYLEASNCYNKTASILTPHFDFTNVVNPYMIFYAYMYGSDLGDLEVYYTLDNGTNWNYVGKLSGEYGDYWIKVAVNFGSLAGESNVQFKFTGITGSSYESDIAIDNFILKDYLPEDYCTASGNMDYDTAVTRVVFNQIDNADGGKTDSYANYTHISTIVKRSQSYDLSVYVDTDGDYTVGTVAWIDWNNDKDFDDPGEEYDLGIANNTPNGLTSDSPLNITIPANAKIGKTRLRIAVKYNDYATSCENGFDGEVEDYTLYITENCNDIALWNGAKWYDRNYNTLQLTDLTDKLLLVDEVFLTNGNNIEACAMSVSASNKVTIETNDAIKITYDLYNDGIFEIKNRGMFVQVDNQAEVEEDGEYSMNIVTQPMNNYYDYAYWSTPIQSFTLGNIVSNAWGYYSFDANTQSWVSVNSNTVLSPGLGYAISAPNGFTGGSISVLFKQNNQKFNFGNIGVGLIVNGQGAQDEDDYNLVGNPYPSPIDFDRLVNDNPNIQGSYYVWTNCAGLNASGHHQESGYTVYSTGSGSVSACNGNGPTATRYIPSGEGFFVEANQSGNLVFKNSQRTVQDNTYLNRTSSNRIWVNLSNNTSFSQILIGFFENATDGMDRLFDTNIIDDTSFAMYSLLNDKKLIIQGLATWDDTNRIIPLGFNTNNSGTHTINLQAVEGVFQNDVNIYLKDLYTNQIIDLKSTSYDFVTTQGSYNDRFQLIFTRDVLDNNEMPSLPYLNLISNDGIFTLISDQNNIEKIDIYTLSGKLLLTYKTKKAENRVSMDLRTIVPQILIFKTRLKDGTQFVLKAIR